MIIQRINIFGFGKLRDLSLEFHPKTNIIFGPNETGKSTLQQALLYFFYGFFQSTRASKQENLKCERFKPWLESQYGGQFWYRLKDGRSFQIDRNFDEDNTSTELFDALTGDQISHQFPSGRHGNIIFQKDHIGMEKQLFQGTSFVSQGEVGSISGSGDLMNDIVAILDSGTKDTSSKNAIEKLQKQISEIGSDRSTTKRLSKLKLKLKSAQSEYDDQMSARNNLTEKVLEKRKLEDSLAKQNNKRFELNYLILTRMIDDKEKQLKQLSIYDKELQRVGEEIASHADLEDFSDELREPIMRRKQNKANYKEQLDDKQKEIDRLNEEKENLDKSQEPVRQFKAIQTSLSYPEFNSLKLQWQQCNEEFKQTQGVVDQEELTLLQDGVDLNSLKELQDLGPTELNKMSDLEEQLKEVESQLDQTQHRYENLENQTWAKGWLRIVTMVGFPIGSLTMLLVAFFTQFTLGFPIAAGLLVLGGIFYQIYRNSRKNIAKQADLIKIDLNNQRKSIKTIHSELQHYYKRFSVESLSQLVTRQMQNQKYLGLVANRNRALESRDKIEFQLLKYLQLLKIKTIESEQLEQLSVQYAQFHETEQKIQNVDQRIQQLAKDCENITGRMHDNQSALQELYLQAGLDVSDPTEAEIEFDRLYQKKKQLNVLKKDKEKQLSAIEGLLTTQSEKEIQSELKELMQRREALLKEFPKMMEKASRLTLPVLKKEFEEVDQERQRWERELSVLDTEIKTILDRHRPLAEVEEEMAQTKSEVEQLEEDRGILELARDILQEVSSDYHRTVIPDLNESVSQAMSHVSTGRYSQVHINPSDMSINLQLPETSTLGSSETLSHGTQEQLYLLLRVSLARLLSASGEPIPLILDDPFVHFDQERLINMLGFLQSLSRENQTFLFTKDPSIKEWFVRNSTKSDYNLISLADIQSANKA